jgi:hypothetical protein
MSTRTKLFKVATTFGVVLFAFLLIGLVTSSPAVSASRVATASEEIASAEPPNEPSAACAGGPTIDGILLDECYIENFTVGGTAKSIRVWYTKNPVTATRMVDSNPVVLSHWINTDAQAQQVAAWGRQAWERYYAIFNHHPYDTGCGNRINIQMEDGVGWAGIAYWGSPGNCNIGIDSPMVRGGGGQWVVYHEFQHYLQYSFNNGCYAYLQANYPSDAVYVEGYADLAADSVTTTLDAVGYGGSVGGYDPTTSLMNKSYGDVYNKYYIEQVGSMYNIADPWHHLDALLSHYTECDNQDDLYVLDTVIPSLHPVLSEEKLFLNFFAANWSKDWANPTTQPELVYTDDDGNPYGQIPLWQNVTLSGGSQNWAGETVTYTWAGKYYQLRPQSGCPYVTAAVNGAAGAHLGINLMAAKTSSPSSVSRTAWIGEALTRTFAAAGVNDRIVAAINTFSSGGIWNVDFTCVTPALDILEPKQTKFALVGDPASPISFLARWKVTSGGSPVHGLPASSFSAEAGGDPVTILTGTLQEVGEEYWAIMLPPIKPAGTTFVNLRICLDASICDSETNSLLYVAPGNTDFALVFDASGSMNTEDVIGEGKRVDNAKKAGTVLADLLRNGDRIAVTDFSAVDNPPGCGLPGGSGNCPLDIQTRLARTDVVVPATISATKNAINLISARAWTPIGAALQDAQNKLVAAPANTNPKHIILLSDGEENVNPLYATIRATLIASGVVVDTIAFSGEAPSALMAQIAADTGGTFRYVPTTGGTLLAPSIEQIDQLAHTGVPPEMINRITTAALPGPLGLDDVYDYYETQGQGASRLFHVNQVAVPDNTYRTTSQFVDDSVNSLRLVVAGKQFDADVPGYCEGYHRNVDVLPPGGDPGKGWIPISPPSFNSPPPANWDIRNSLYDDVVIITNPVSGTWQVRARHYYWAICLGGKPDLQATARLIANSPTEFETDFMMNGSAETDVRLQGRFLTPIVNNQGLAGDNVPIVGTLLTRSGAKPGAIVIASIEKPGALNAAQLFDDGLHSDGVANDGIYGGFYSQTDVGGTYNVRLYAFWYDPIAASWASREWNGAFWIKGPDPKTGENDQDHDGMPDNWEIRCKLDPNKNDALGDLDRDGLTNIDEFQRGTLPCRADTDGGGERDGSEVATGRNPLNPADDKVRPLGHINFRPLNQAILIHWTHPLSYTGMLLYVSTVPGQLGSGPDMGTGGTYTLTGLTNEQTYYLTLAGVNGTAQGDYSYPTAVTPKADPDAPSGAILINEGNASAWSKNVVLDITSTDTPLPGAAESANAHQGGPLALLYDTVSAGVEMKISNDPSFAGAIWEPLVQQKPWILGSSPSAVYRVYAQFRDAAQNESLVVYDDIVVYLNYLPIILRE